MTSENTQNNLSSCRPFEQRTFSSLIQFPGKPTAQGTFLNLKTRQYIMSNSLKEELLFYSIDSKWVLHRQLNQTEFWPRRLCVQPHTDNLLICDDYKRSIRVMTDTNNTSVVLIKTPSIEYQSTVCCDEKGNIALSTTEKVILFDAAGRLKYNVTDSFISLKNICLLPSQFYSTSSLFLVIDGEDKKLSMIDQNGLIHHHIDLNFGRIWNGYPLYLCVDLNGMVYIGNTR